jgi:hypothetical protein
MATFFSDLYCFLYVSLIVRSFQYVCVNHIKVAEYALFFILSGIKTHLFKFEIFILAEFINKLL